MLTAGLFILYPEHRHYYFPHGVSEVKTATNGCKNRRYNTLIFS